MKKLWADYTHKYRWWIVGFLLASVVLVIVYGLRSPEPYVVIGGGHVILVVGFAYYLIRHRRT